MADFKAATILDAYGNYQSSNTFANNENVPDVNPSTQAYSAAHDADSNVKRHAACDDCRMLISLSYNVLADVPQGSAS